MVYLWTDECAWLLYLPVFITTAYFVYICVTVLYNFYVSQDYKWLNNHWLSGPGFASRTPYFGGWVVKNFCLAGCASSCFDKMSWHGIISRLEARLSPNIGFTLRGNLAMFTRSGGYNSAKSESIWIKSGALWVHCWGLAHFGRDLHSSKSMRGRRDFVFCPVNNARFFRFSVGNISRHLNTTSIGEAVKTFGTEFWKFYSKGSFYPKKTQKLLNKFPGLANSGSCNSDMITDRPKITTKIALYGMSSFHF